MFTDMLLVKRQMTTAVMMVVTYPVVTEEMRMQCMRVGNQTEDRLACQASM
jgi:hypothetical protein